jgi:hypothetical protein
MDHQCTNCTIPKYFDFVWIFHSAAIEILSKVENLWANNQTCSWNQAFFKRKESFRMDGMLPLITDLLTATHFVPRQSIFVSHTKIPRITEETLNENLIFRSFFKMLFVFQKETPFQQESLLLNWKISSTN